ncbi:MAG: signal peptidase II [Chloroflexota bacterium]|nr:MAG: signal peptidase II [Chloroflexota bacterium]
MSEEPTSIATEDGTQGDAGPPAHKEKASWQERGIVFLVMGLVLLADHLSKVYVESRLPLNNTWAPFPEWESLFRITHVSNTGAAFGLFRSGNLVLSIVAVVVSIVIILYNRYLPAHMYWYRLALGLQLGGALGNLLSRVRVGHVTDFLDFGPVPVFNVADMSIVTGTILLGFLMLFDQPRREDDSEALDDGGTSEEERPTEDTAEDQSLLLNE